MKKFILLFVVIWMTFMTGCANSAPVTSSVNTSPEESLATEAVSTSSDASNELEPATTTAGRILTLPTSEMFGLAGLEKTVFDAVIDERAKRLTDTDSNSTLIIPIIFIYGTYEMEGKTAVVCCVGESFYYYDKPETQTVSIGGGTTPAMVLCEKQTDESYKAVSLTYAGDGEGWGDSVRGLCGPLKDLAEGIIDGTETGETTMASAPDLLRIYIYETGADIKYVDMFGNIVTLEQYRGGV